MSLTSQQIKTINQRASATEGKNYISFDGKKYVGLPNGRLKLIDKFEAKLRKDINSNDKELTSLDDRVTKNEADILLKDDIVDVDKKLATLECKLIAMNIVLG